MTIEERINELGEKYEKQKEINKELVDENEALKFAARMSEKTEKQLRKENAELKEKIEVLECDNYNANCNLNLITDQLTIAKEIIMNLRNIITSDITIIDTEEKGSFFKQAVEFLKEEA